MEFQNENLVATLSRHFFICIPKAKENFSTYLFLTDDLYQGHMIKNKFFQVHHLVIATQPKQLTVVILNICQYQNLRLIRFWEQLDRN